MINKIFAVLLMLGFAGSSFAANLLNLQTKDLDAIQVSEHNDYNDASFMQVWYVGSSAECQVVITQNQFGTEVPEGTADLALDTSASAYDTLGELCDYIESEDDYNCALTGGKRDDDSTLLKVIASADATECQGKAGYEVLIDTGGVTATDPYIMRVGITPNSGRRVILKQCRVQNDAVGTLTVYGKLAKFEGATDGVTRNDTTLVWTEITANDTAEYVPAAEKENGWLEFGKDEHVVISAGNASEPQTSTSYLECFWTER